MALWKNKLAVLRDLQEVTKGHVRVTSITGDKPTPLMVNEETEEEYFQHCAGDADFSQAPDLASILQMINLVENVENSDGDSPKNRTTSEKVIQISKLNPGVRECIPQNVGIKELDKLIGKKIKKAVKPRKNHRNAAMESIANLANDKNADANIQEIKLLKPTDFLTNNEINQSDNKPSENGTKDTADNSLKNGLILTPTTSMFKRKSPVKSPKSPPAPVENVVAVTNVPQKTYKSFKPSAKAGELYKQFVEKSTMRETVTEDIWSRAERLMKEIEEKKQKEIEEKKLKELEEQQLLEIEKERKKMEEGIEESDNSQVDQANVETVDDGSIVIIHEENVVAVNEEKLEPVTDEAEVTEGDENLEDEENILEKDLDDLDSSNSEGYPDTIRLPQHRHNLTGECLVCKVMCEQKGEQ